MWGGRSHQETSRLLNVLNGTLIAGLSILSDVGGPQGR
jgi:hypothetical protein